jgi:hypothetical protein
MTNITMPDDSIISKFEETDMGDNYGDNMDRDYMAFMRQELIDQTPDVLPTTDGEHANPNTRGTISRNVLNNRFNAGTRHGEEFLDTVHDGIFLGDMEVDPRGVDPNPNFTHMRKQTSARFKDHEVIMGHNVGATDYVEVEGPKNAVRLQKERVETHMRNKKNMKWFSTSKENQNRRGPKADAYDNAARVKTRDGMTEGLRDYNNIKNMDPRTILDDTDVGLWKYTLAEKFNRSIQTSVSHGKLPITHDTGMWRNTGIAALAVQKYTDYTGGGKTKFSDKSKVGESDTTQRFASHKISSNPTNINIANTMKTIMHVHETQAKSKSKMSMNPGTKRQDNDLNSINYNTHQTQSATKSKNGMMIGSNLNYKSDVQAAIFSAKHTQRTTANSRMAEANKIAAVLGGKTKSNNRETQNMATQDQLRGKDQKSNTVSKFRVESRDMIKDKFNSRYKIAVPSISHLTVQTYTSNGKDNTIGLVKEGKIGGFTSVVDSSITRDRGRNKKDTFIGLNKHDSELGDNDSNVFGSNYAVGSSGGGHGFAKSGLTSNKLSDKGVDGRFGDSLS